MQNILEVKNLKKHFKIKKSIFSLNKNTFHAVDSVHFSIKKGEIFGLVGESGCGKSTTAKLILNLLEPTFGNVTFMNKILFDTQKNIKINKKDLLSIRKDMQMIFQDPYSSLDPRKNIKQILSEGIKKHKITDKQNIDNLVKENLDRCGINLDALSRYPHQFSGGQRQRIGIARALSTNPKFIVCDEPTASLDVSIQSQILNLMLDLKDSLNLSYLFISHNLNIVKNFCDNMGVMYLGILVEKGTSKEVFNNPYHPYTKALIYSIPKSHPLQKKERIKLLGALPSASKIPTGCRFHSRCPYCMDICKIKEPNLKNISENHYVACHLY